MQSLKREWSFLQAQKATLERNIGFYNKNECMHTYIH